MAGRKKYAAKNPRDAKLDRSLGVRRGKQADKKMSALGRRKVSRATKKK
tara:strand:+ start:341 stop:487 length:147 start_codon:yes stop_codon:yes gene_type:complete